MYKWFTTKHKGLRYREHSTRKHGIKKDRFYQHRQMVDGRRIQESFGWLSEGWTEERCLVEISKLKIARKTGEGPCTLKDIRILQAKGKTPFELVFNRYIEQATVDRGEDLLKSEKSYFKTWIQPEIGRKPLRDISPFHLEKIKKNMSKAGRTPRTIEYALAIVRQTYNYARNNDMFTGDPPTNRVKVPRADNKRTRFLSRDEADLLLSELKEYPQIYNMALLSLHTGARAGEIFSLTFSCIDLQAETILLKDTKNKNSRVVYATDAVKRILAKLIRESNNCNDLVFPNGKGSKHSQIPKPYRRITGKLFNKNVEDSRQRVIFHTLRHTFASWLVMDGVDLYRVQKLMGHKTIAMTQRYAHLAPDTLKTAISSIETPKNEKKLQELKKAESY